MNKREQLGELRNAIELYRSGQYARSFNILRKIEKDCQSSIINARVAHLKISCLMRVGNIDQAKEQVDRYLNEKPLSGRMNMIAAKFYREIGEVFKAERLYLRAVCLEPDNEEFALAYAQFCKERHNLTKAQSILKRALCILRQQLPKENPRLYLLYLELAHLYYETGQYLRALVLFSHTSVLSEDFPYYDLLADCFLSQRNYAEAYAAIKTYLEEWGDDDPTALYIYAKCLSGLGRSREALSALRKCQKAWGELIVTSGDIVHLYPLLQDGSIQKIPETTIQIFDNQD